MSNRVKVFPAKNNIVKIVDGTTQTVRVISTGPQGPPGPSSIFEGGHITGPTFHSGSFTISGSFLDLSQATAVTGSHYSASVSSTASFGRLEIAGNSLLNGNVTIGGNINIGDADTDSLTISSDVSSNFIPDVNSSFNLGSSSKNWKFGYIEQITSTHVTASGNISSSGDLFVTQNVDVDGASNFQGDVTLQNNFIISGHVTASSNISSSNTSTGSFGSLRVSGISVPDIKVFSGSLSTRITNDSSSFSSRITSDSSSFSSRITSDSSSFSSRITSDSSSFSSRITNDSSSISTRLTTEEANVDALQTDSGSFSTRLTTEESNVDALQLDSGSFSSRTTTLEGNGTIQGVGTQNTPTFAGLTSTDDVTIEGTLTAETYVVSSSITTMSIAQASGSTLFGNSQDDTHVFVGDVISGSSSSTGSFGSLRISDVSVPNLKILSSSIQTRLNTEEINVDNLQTDSGSFSSRITDDSGSFSSRITSDSSSISTRLTLEESNIDALQVDSGSLSLRITQATSSIFNLKADSGSFSTRVTDLKTNSGSFSTRVTNLKSDSGSFSTRVTNLKADSGSFSTRVTGLKADSGSFSTRVTTIETNVGGQSLNTTDSPTFAGLTIDGDLLAQRYIVSSSVSHITSSFSSGSTIFGDTDDDTHQFTGSIKIDGGSLSPSSVTGSFTSVSSSISSRLTTEQVNVDSLQADSGSFSTRITNLKIDSGSVSTRVTSLESNPVFTSVGISGSFQGELSSSVYLKQVGSTISGSFTQPSSSISTRITSLESNPTFTDSGISGSFTSGFEFEGSISGSSESTGSFGSIEVGGGHFTSASLSAGGGANLNNVSLLELETAVVDSNTTSILNVTFVTDSNGELIKASNS